MTKFIHIILSLILITGLAGCATEAVNRETAALVLEPASFTALPQWSSDRQAESLAAFKQSCATLAAKSPAARYGGLETVAGMNADWQPACAAALAMPAAGDAQARAFFEQWFQPWQATAEGEKQGLFTGYYESSLNGSRTRHDQYQYPLRARPDDLVMVDLGEFRPELKGQRIAGRVMNGSLKPYEDNRAISTGRLPTAADVPLVWIDDPVEAVFIQIQGSGVINLDDGTTMRVGYAAQNGYPYYAIGRELVKRGYLAKEDVSMQSIRAWLLAHPAQAPDILYTNRSYVFFQDMGPGPAGNPGPKGAAGVALTPGRSLAVDHGRIPYGVPVFVSADHDFNRLMVAQDTGGAIRGAVRGDVFWGRGAEAEQKAGAMKSTGRMWLLLPKTLRPQS